MTLKPFIAFALAGLAAFQVVAQEAAAAAEENKELEAEISYVEALVRYGYPDFASPVIEATKKKWPESEARFFAIEIRSMLSLGKFAEAEKKIAALPDRKSSKYWAARLEVANNYFGRGQKKECMKIYNEFFKLFPKPPKDIRKFYIEASYAYGQLLLGDKQYAQAAKIYSGLLTQLKGEEWCSIAVETVEIYLRLAEHQNDPKDASAKSANLAAAQKIVDKLLWQQGNPVLFGRAVAMKAHIEQIRGDIERAAALIDEYMAQLRDIHDQIKQVDPDGKFGLMRQSPLPECRYLQAKMRWDEALRISKSPKPDDEAIKALMFGPRVGGKRVGAKGAFNIAVAVFLNYELSPWAPVAGELSEEIKKFAEKRYNAKIKTKVTPEQIAKVRAAQFKNAAEIFASGDYLKSIDAYMDVLSRYPELLDSVQAVENVASAYIDLILQTKDEKLKDEYRMNADAVSGYLAERFAGAKEKVIMMAAGDAVIRLAAKEQEYRNLAAADRLYTAFFTNYRKHTAAATLAAAKAMELQRAERYPDAIKYWDIISKFYSNTTMYASSLAQLSACYGKLGDSGREIEYISRYIPAESVRIRKLQAQFRLAQMYQRAGLQTLTDAGTNSVPEEVEAAELKGTTEIIKAIKQFSGFTAAVDEALADPSTPKGDISKYKELKEAAMFMVGECWARMTRPEKNLPAYRAKAAASYEEYLKQYPEGKWAKTGYVKLGTIYTAIGDMAKSKDALDRLSRKFPDSDEAKNAKPRLAKSLIEMGMKKEGAEIYGEMLRTDGAYTAMQFVNAGEALLEAKNWDLANQAFEKAVTLASTGSVFVVAKARLGQARGAYLQGSFAEAREALDRFLQDEKMSRLSLAADANFMLVEVASDQGRVEKDTVMRGKYFGAAIGALKKVRQYWSKKPRWEQDKLDILSGNVLIDRMKAEESMGLKEEALETCGRAAATFQVFIQAHGVSESHPLDKMQPGELANLEQAYASIVPLFSKMGADKADLVIRFGQAYLDLFPNGKDKTEISNCMNKAKADLPAK